MTMKIDWILTSVVLPLIGSGEKIRVLGCFQRNKTQVVWPLIYIKNCSYMIVGGSGRIMLLSESLPTDERIQDNVVSGFYVVTEEDDDDVNLCLRPVTSAVITHWANMPAPPELVDGVTLSGLEWESKRTGK